ncbi:MAG: Gfo/Idh/MocA family protein [Pseudonocardiaceae bacterium]
MAGGEVRFGVLGCASIAWRRTLPAMVEADRARLIAVASRRADKARRFGEHFGCAWVCGYEELLNRDDIDAIYIALPAALHTPWAARALRAGKHVLVEKPLAGTGREARSLVDLAGKVDRRLMENRMFAYHQQHRAVDELVADGAIGELRAFCSAMAIPPLPDDDIRYRADLGGGALLDAGFYPVHAALRFLGPSLEVRGAQLFTGRQWSVETRGAALLCTADGVTAQVSFGFEHAYRSSYELWGDRGRISVARAFTPLPSWQPVLRIERQDRTEELTLPADHQFRNVIETFSRHALDGGGDAPDLDIAVGGLDLMDDIRDRAGVACRARQLEST